MTWNIHEIVGIERERADRIGRGGEDTSVQWMGMRDDLDIGPTP